MRLRMVITFPLLSLLSRGEVYDAPSLISYFLEKIWLLVYLTIPYLLANTDASKQAMHVFPSTPPC